MCDHTCMNHKNSLKNLACPNGNCPYFRKHRQGNIIRHSFYKTRQGRRRRYRCKDCGRTFSSTYGTAYYRLQSSRSRFDDVATMSVNGIGKSAISRIKRLSWNTVDRWLHQAFSMPSCSIPRHCKAMKSSNSKPMRFGHSREAKRRSDGCSTALEVSSRIWVGLVVGSRTYKNVKRCLFDVLPRGVYSRFLFTTDGFDVYAPQEVPLGSPKHEIP